MSRLTKNISKRQDYCGYEVKEATYQNIYGTFSKYKDIEDNVDCDLTLAIDKLGQLEDIEEKIGIDLITLFKALKNGVYKGHNMYHYDVDFGIYGEDFMFSSGLEKVAYIKDYRKTWYLKEDKSE